MTTRRDSSRCSAARRWRGRSGRARSRASGCAASAFSCILPADEPESQARIAALDKDFSNSAGLTAATCGSTTAGQKAKPIFFVKVPRNWPTRPVRLIVGFPPGGVLGQVKPKSDNKWVLGV